MSPRLALAGVAGVRGDRLLFSGIDLHLRAGEIAVVTGPNGAGKSTLLRIAAGLLSPAAGAVARNGRVGWAGEATALDPDQPLGRALGWWAAIDGAAPAALDRAMHAVALVPLTEVPVRALSTGQRRRASIARVIAGGAELWLLDEPLAGLDTASGEALAAALRAHAAAGGAALVATHQPLDVRADHQLAIAP